MDTKQILKNINNVRAVLIGDLCLDVYWSADMTKSRLSRETAHFPLPVVAERMSPGAGGNAASCMAGLVPKNLQVIGVTGNDWRGDVLQKLLFETPGLTPRIVTSPDYRTNAYIKPMRFGYSKEETEDPRLDFENYAPLPEEAETAVLSALNDAVKDADVLVVSDQMTFGVVTEKVRERIIALASEGLPVFVDSRDRIGLYRHCTLKPNEIECARALSLPEAALSEGTLEETWIPAAKALSEKCASQVCLTLGSHGAVYYDEKKAVFGKAVPVDPPVDIVGAGDCFLSAFSLAMTAGTKPEDALSFAAYASAVTVKKLGTTGTASPEEILQLKEK